MVGGVADMVANELKVVGDVVRDMFANGSVVGTVRSMFVNVLRIGRVAGVRVVDSDISVVYLLAGNSSDPR